MVQLTQLTKKDLASDQDVRWCPGCGDYAILTVVQKTLAELNINRDETVFVSGIGCSSRFPYYMNTYGFHTIHGRAPTFATGMKLTNPNLSVWLVTGDGDGLSIGGNHMLHVLRRNVDVNILLFNNRIYGLTKGQYSPTSERGKKAKSTPDGSVDYPFSPVAVALGANAPFVARSSATETKHLAEMLKRAAEYKGAAFIEIFQNCNVFNDGAFDYFTDREVAGDKQIHLEHGKPMLFGKQKDKGLRLKPGKLELEVVKLGENGVGEKDILVHDETNAALAFLLTHIEPPDFPMPFGVLYHVERESYEDAVHRQTREILEKKGKGDLEKLLTSGDTWVVK
jgi:2-oxoglutarate ferredoxin oxidoreductase subunit beta